jgi:hypothetical protein
MATALARMAFATRVAFTAVVAATVPAHADDVADFYKGKQLRLIVGSAVGGGYDL